MSAKGRAFKLAVVYCVVKAGLKSLGDKKLKITMVLRPRDKRKIDIDNRIKSVLDALENSGLFDNDYQVDDLRITRGELIKDGCIVVTIEELSRQAEGESRQLDSQDVDGGHGSATHHHLT